jgi:release factor glutamine methyltransferase
MTTPRTPSSVPPAAPEAVVAALRDAGCVFAEEEAALLAAAAGTPDRLASLVARRAAGEPLEHVVGWAEFRGLRIDVAPGVFVPRRRSEFLVGRALALAPEARVVVDLCCGSGALGAALAVALPGAELHAADIDPTAVACARSNLAPYRGRVHHGDLFAALPAGLRGRIEILAANVPYVPTADLRLLPAEAREHEPSAALDGGPDGLAVLRRVATGAPGWLAPGGCLLAETSGRQAAAAERAFADAGLAAEVAVCEDSDAHVITGVLPPATAAG